jgi:Mg2+/Co2+ transporter CorB
MVENKNDEKRIKLYKKRTGNKKPNFKWILIITLWTFIISALINFVSDIILSNVNIIPAVFVLILIISIGILFDIIGVAVTAADEVPFHSMASRKVKGARTSVFLIRNADRVSNLCNDVIGDICGVVSGGLGAVIIGKIMVITGGMYKTILTLLIGALVASVTVSGKAIGKNFAISESNNIVYSVAWFMETIKKTRK